MYVYYENGTKISARKFSEDNDINEYVFVFRRAKKGITAEQILQEWKFRHNTPDNYMTVHDAAKLLNVNDDVVSSRIRKGKIKAEKHGSSWYIPREQFSG